SIEPIKRFLKTCRQFEANKQESFTRIQLFKDNQWHFSILRPIRKLGTVYFDEDHVLFAVSQDMLADVKKYLEPSTRKFYSDCGIPYRRGYLLHGPPGTGKMSLSLALAGHLRVNIYLVHLPSVETDSDLQNLFGQLPPKCIVLLEDIDATGNTKKKSETISKVSSCTLSGFLIVLDGPSSQEKRIVLMTSNIAEKLDPALIRPGRIDKKIFLGLMSQKSAERMFLGMYKPAVEAPNLAEQFASAIPDRKFTPAQLQEYLLMRKESLASAAEGIADRVKENLRNKIQ
ncbi:P-loop containing nucleoside triphosphate hydrolase protein, partial [Bisporella sp. PMI_857]